MLPVVTGMFLALQITINTDTEAVKVIPVSESTLRLDMKSGKVSFEIDAKGFKQIDAPELTHPDRQTIGSLPSWFWSGVLR